MIISNRHAPSCSALKNVIDDDAMKQVPNKAPSEREGIIT
jgi:hypothetical protein